MKTQRRKTRRNDAPTPSCPWCGEAFEVWIDQGAGEHQRYVEDCAVCCHPCVVTVSPGEPDEAGASSESGEAPDAVVSVERE